MKSSAGPDVESIVELARTLIGVPSQGGLDAPGPIIETMGQWLVEHHLEPTVLRGADRHPVGLKVDIGAGTRPHWCLNACLDTAPFGDVGAWSDPPTAATLRAGWLGGRGSADCKTAVAIFAHIGVVVNSETGDWPGTLTLLFDADEHTGRFGGVHAYAATGARPDGVMIGYPGLDEVVIGARGFWRGTLHVFGRSGHTGSRRVADDNAVVKAAALVRRLADVEVASDLGPDFPLPPKVTVTGISGGQGHAIVPDHCTVSVDIRLTPRHDAPWAHRLVHEVCQALDDTMPSRRPTAVEADTTWPAYRLPASSPLATALKEAARQATGRDVPLAVAGPSNIGNFLATRGIEATCGFGVAFRNLHAADEAIEVASVPLVYGVYLDALRRLLARASRQSSGSSWR